jgi:hypothetical protein
MHARYEATALRSSGFTPGSARRFTPDLHPQCKRLTDFSFRLTP